MYAQLKLKSVKNEEKKKTGLLPVINNNNLNNFVNSIVDKYTNHNYMHIFGKLQKSYSYIQLKVP